MNRRRGAPRRKQRAARPGTKVSSLFAAACGHHQRGDIGAAEVAYRRVLELDPAHQTALLNYGLLAQATDRLVLALELLERGARAAPENADIVGTLGSLLAEAERWPQATTHLERAAAMAPDDAVIRFNLAKAYQHTGQPERATDLLRSLSEESPRDPEVWTAYGAALLDAGASDSGIAALQTALALDPSAAHAHNELGGAYLEVGRFEAAGQSFRAALASDPSLAQALGNLARSRRYSTADAADAAEIAQMEAVLGRGGLSPRAASEVHFALGKVYDDCADYAQAGRHYDEANALRAREARFDAAARADEVERIIDQCSAEQLAVLRGLGHASEQPVFIVGMPRSGTSLVEQVIASHSQASGAGELPHLPRLAAELGQRAGRPYPECLSVLTEALASAMAEAYLETLRARGEAGSARITDKLPGNFNYLGLIAVVFPNARVIHCVREPLDVCLSIYSRPFTFGHEFAYRLPDIAAEYRAYRRLMAHWRAVCPLAIYDLRYEDVVRDPEAAIRGLIAHCGLGWEAQCLDFHRSSRRVRTASQWQVRQPIYSTSVERWRHFEPQARELQRLLGAGETAV